MEFLLVLIGLAVVIAPFAGFFMALGARSRLTVVENRLAAIEFRLGLYGAPGAVVPTAEPFPGGPFPGVPYPGAPYPGMPYPEGAPQPGGEVPWPPPQGGAEPSSAPAAAAAGDVPPGAGEPAGAEPASGGPAAGEPAGAGPVPPDGLPPADSGPLAPAPSFEEQFGTRWVVWVGGVALALGGIFLVRYSIEQGLIGPKLRILLGALLAAGLIGAGEWTRRKENLSGISGLPTAHIPSILTAAGTTVAYATVYAAYALYGFLSAGSAFVLLGIVALATLAAALLHGPALAGLGVIGAYVTPLLVVTTQPNYWALYLYLAVVTAAAFGLARMRLWRWLALAAIAFGFLWMLPGLTDYRVDSLTPHAFHAVAGFVLVALLIVAGLFFGPGSQPGRVDAVSSLGVVAYLTAAALLVIARRHDTLALTTFALLTVGTIAVAWRAESAVPAVPVAAILAALVMAHWAVRFELEHLIAPGGPVAGTVDEPAIGAVGGHLALGGAFAVLFGAAGFLAQGRSERAIAPVLWAAAAVFAPLAILLALYYRIFGFEQSIPFAALALLLAALFSVATELLGKRPPRPGLAAAGAIFAVGAVGALGLALTLALEKGWLTVGLSLMAPGIAYVAEKRPLPALRVLAAVVGVVVLARVAFEPRIVGSDIGTTPIFNWILYGYGVPALSFWTAGYLLRRRADDLPARFMDAFAILFTVLTAFLEIRHYVNGGDVYRPTSSLAEVGLQVSVGLAIAIGLERLRGRTQNIVHDIGAQLVALATLGIIVFGLLGSQNPLFRAAPIEGEFFNTILLSYGLPAVLAITLALIAKTTRPMPYRAVAAITAVVLALAYLTLEVRRLYQGPLLSRAGASDAELWTYSAVWLAFGVVLLIVGILLRSQPARLASAAVILLTVAKVFLYDLAGITGVWRALSFIGLGLVLVGIGWLYQRLLFPRIPLPPAAAPAAPTAPAAEPSTGAQPT